MNAQTHIALPTTAADLVDEYDRKAAGIEAAVSAFKAAADAMNMAATVRGTYVEPVLPPFHLSEKELQKNLLKSGWRAVYSHLQIARIASAKDKQLFERTIADPPPLTLDNAKATFGDYFLRPRFHILRGLAEVFSSLDPAYKSHSKVKLGVKGLPKRVVLSWGDYAHGHGFDKFVDIVNALAALRGQMPFEWSERSAIQTAHDLGEDAVLDGRTYTTQPRYSHQRAETFQTIDRGLTIRRFLNGNAHVFFDKWALLDINRALAEFYGEVLPDVDPANPTRTPSTAVAKDLQFYWSPPAVVAAALEFADIHERQYYRGDRPAIRVLEPSCGDGRIMDELQARGVYSFGIEYDAGRAAQAKAKGHPVQVGNFLEQEPPRDPGLLFDAVVMNPPFYGKHYAKHVRHALRFLKPGGTLVAILPATARYDHNELSDLEGGYHREHWRDLPTASFAEAGTNVPTVLFRAFRPKD